MSFIRQPDELPERLKQAVESLALEVVMQDDPWDADGGDSESRATVPDGVPASLRGIQDTAEEAGCPETCRAAADLLQALADRPGSNPMSLFKDGLARLQQVLEHEQRTQAAATTALAELPTQRATEEALSVAQDPEMIGEFILESRDHLASVEIHLLAIEHDPGNLEPLHTAFRGFHTIKGLAGFLELNDIQEVAHQVENVLDSARNAHLTITPDVIDVVLAGADYLRSAIDRVEKNLQQKDAGPAIDSNLLLRRITSLLAGEPDGKSRSAPASEERASVTPAPTDSQPAEVGSAAPMPAGANQAQSVKIDTSKLDHLVDMIGEMVIAQSLLQHDPEVAGISTPRLQRTITELGRITTDVQRITMSLRMVPIGNLFQRMSRLVRDLSRKAGKRVELVTAGEETELDRNIVEELTDPFLHMIRNAIDHGLEPPEERIAAGKPSQGKISLSAYHQAGLIVIEVSDDGRGMNRDRILAKARQTGLVEDGRQLSDNEVFSFIFEPGFSTAAKITEVSGRGVGMDVVKRNISRMRGSIDVRSTAGRGSAFLLKVPLTLAIIDGLVVRVGEQRYVVPISNVREMLQPSADILFSVQSRDEMVMVRGELVPLVRVHTRFNIASRLANPSDGVLIVAETVGKRFCLLVDQLLGKQEVVIKSLGETFKNLPGISGGTILGDGRVSLILDLEGLFGAGASA